ncbi:MAG: cytochrome c, class IC [Nitrobacter sp.]|uniref:c-type cytochrome n=1 Tax=Nitrobacter sp. TaxID=29420 RepID=UPI00387DF4BE
MKTQMVAAMAGLVVLLASSTSQADQSSEQIYGVYCVQCHGLQRNGTGINVPALSVKPRDHTDAKSMGDTSDDELVKAITEGGLAVNKSVLMPTWGHVLSKDQIKGLAKYLRQVCKCGK